MIEKVEDYSICGLFPYPICQFSNLIKQWSSHLHASSKWLSKLLSMVVVQGLFVHWLLIQIFTLDEYQFFWADNSWSPMPQHTLFVKCTMITLTKGNILQSCANLQQTCIIPQQISPFKAEASTCLQNQQYSGYGSVLNIQMLWFQALAFVEYHLSLDSSFPTTRHSQRALCLLPIQYKLHCIRYIADLKSLSFFPAHL